MSALQSRIARALFRIVVNLVVLTALLVVFSTQFDQTELSVLNCFAIWSSIIEGAILLRTRAG